MTSATGTQGEALLGRVRQALDLILAEAAQYQGLVPSILDRQTGRMVRGAIPGPVAGQRQHDRAPCGSNVLHDVALVELLDLLGGDYADAGDRYLRRFVTHCTRTPSGLFPWGEHAYWDLVEDRLGNSNAWVNRTISRGAYHDHLREVPVWLWDKLYAIEPACVERFADGLKYHWKSGALAHEYFRHAYIEYPEIPLPHEAISRDFPRHGGFYMLDWAYALTKFSATRQGRADFRGNLVRMLDYWWPHRGSGGLLPGMSRCDNDDPSCDRLSLIHTVPVVICMLEAESLLRRAGVATDVAEVLRERALVYLAGCLEAPGDPAAGEFTSTVDRATGQPVGRYVAWGSRYGATVGVAAPALLMLRIGPLVDEPRCLAWAEHAARWILREEFDPADQIYARDGGQALTLLSGLYEATGDATWLVEGARLSDRLLPLYLDGPLPRGATTCDWYEGQLGAGDLLLGLGQLAVHQAGGRPTARE